MNTKRYLVTVIVMSVLCAGVLSQAGSAEQAPDAVRRLNPVLVWSGAKSKIVDPTYTRIISKQEWRNLWLRHYGSPSEDRSQRRRC